MGYADYAREIVATAGAVTFEAYLNDKTLRLATERRFEIVGEAARRVSRPFQEAHIHKSHGKRSPPSDTSLLMSTLRSRTIFCFALSKYTCRH